MHHSLTPTKHQPICSQHSQFLKRLALSLSLVVFLCNVDLDPGYHPPSPILLNPFLNKFNVVCACDRRWNFNIFATRNIHWSSMKIEFMVKIVLGAGNQFWVLATVVLNAVLGTTIINHVLNYPLGCTIPYTQNILLFSLTN